MIWLGALLLLAGAGNGFAQFELFEERETMFGDSALRSHAAATADLDLDGDLDVVFGTVASDSSCAVYLNRDGRFGAVPDWEPEGPYPSVYDVALGDLNGDGLVDLVCATNAWFPAVAYYGTGETFHTTPDWKSTPRPDTRSVALADFDGDGYLDLACGDGSWAGGPDMVFRGTATGLDTIPTWISNPSYSTQSVVWADVNGDSLLDLVCGHSNAPEVAYLNLGGAVLDTLPGWTALDSYSTNDIALADLDGDDLLDLVCGTASDQPILVYLNSGTLFADTPSWTFGPRTNALGVALKDLDGDGRVDVVAAVEGDWNEIYRNRVGGLHEASPILIGEENTTAQAVITPDLNGDGRPDLVFANNTDNTYHLNRSFPFVTDPFWSAEMDIAKTHFSAAFGFVDGDEYPDLVVSAALSEGYNQNQLYLNRGGFFDDTPTWKTPDSEHTKSVALADIDGDGEADLVCGNIYVGNSVYLNAGSSFADTVAWRSDATWDTEAIACGDVDADGDVDLVCANWGQVNELYLNDGGMLPTSASWTSRDSLITRCLALVDLDGDRDLDLICGNGATEGGEVNQVFLYEAGSFGETAHWDGTDTKKTRSLAVGDIDGDGLHDIVFGNIEQTNEIYLGVGGGNFVRSTDELTLARETAAISLVDVDADGDLDLLCFDSGPDGLGVSIYPNVDGHFSDANRIESEDVFWPGGVAVGDMDLDGDPDLVIPGSSRPPELLRGRYGSGRLGPLDGMRVRYPNHAPLLRDVTVSRLGDQQNLYHVTLLAEDSESDPLCVVPEYQLAGDPVWYRPDVSIAKALGPLSASPDGDRHVLEWYVWDAPIDDRDVIVRLRAVPFPSSDARVELIPAHIVNAGPLVVSRPEIHVSATELDFPTVTVGDVREISVRIDNEGTAPLVINETDDVELPSQMRLDPPPPYSIPARSGLDVTVYLEPTVSEISGSYWSIDSNDSLTGTVVLPVTTNVLGLTDGIITQLLSPTEYAVLGDALTVICTPGDDVMVDDGYLVYRAGGAEAFADSVALEKQTGEGGAGEYYFYATIPGEHVTEQGLEYFVRLRNSGVFDVDPAGAPGAFVTQLVDPPAEFESYATHTSGNDFLQGRPIFVTATLDAGMVYESGRLYYRRGGDAEYTPVDLDPAGVGGPTAAIPDSALGSGGEKYLMVGPRGVEYYVEMNTASTELRDPPLLATVNRHVLPIKVRNLVEPRVIPARTYRMVSIPLTFEEDSEKTIIEILSEQAEFGEYDPVNWRCFRYDPFEQRNVEATSSDPMFRPEPGRGYWLVSAQESSMSTGTTDGFSPDTSAPWEIDLVAGSWNQIGHPFAFPVAWSDVTVDGVPAAQALDAADGIELAIWHPETQGYEMAAPDSLGYLEPFRGYFIMNRGAEDAVLRVAPIAIDPDTVSVPARSAPPAAAAQDGDAETWSLVLGARCADRADPGITAGIHPEADDDLDRLDRAKAPASPVPGLRIYFPSSERNRHLGAFASDLRPAGVSVRPGERGWTWHLDVAKDFDVDGTGDEVLLEVTGLEAVPGEYEILLLDRIAQQTTDLRETATYTYHQGRRAPVAGTDDARFQLLVGTPEYVTSTREFDELPGRMALGRNRPNPFNPATLVRYDLDRAAHVRLNVYDVRGQLVCTLLDETKSAGRYEVLWDGTDRSGGQVASGVYFSRMTTDTGFGATRKMLLVR